MGGTYKMITLVGTSKESWEQAIRNAIGDAAASVRQLSWFEVLEMRGSVVAGDVAEFQVKLQAGLKVESGG